MDRNSDLDHPMTLRCGLTIPNHFALAPLTNTQSNHDGTLHQNELEWLAMRAGNFGLISTCATFVSEEGHAWDGQLGISEDRHLKGLQKLAQSIKEKGSIAMVQLHHGGKRASLAPRKISADSGDGYKQASQTDIGGIIRDFTQAAIRAENAGFDGVEIHGANGYIFTQFLAPKENHREDEYGGDISGRARLLRETVQSVRAEVSEEFMVNVRISPVDRWEQKGILLKDSIEVTKWLASDGVDIIHLSLQDVVAPGPFEKNHIPVVKAIREAIPPEVKVAAAGGIWDRSKADNAHRLGVDQIVMGKAAIVHPDWPEVSKYDQYQPMLPPWEPDYLRIVGVSPKFLEYLKKFPGLIVGGTPPRNSD